jgi:hypothetical protein
MSAAKWLRFAVLLCFVGLFGWIAYVRAEVIWILAGAIFMVFALYTLRK